MSILAKSANEISKLGEGKIVYMVKDSRIEKNKQNEKSKIFPLTITNGAKVLKIKNIWKLHYYQYIALDKKASTRVKFCD